MYVFSDPCLLLHGPSVQINNRPLFFGRFPMYQSFIRIPNIYPNYWGVTGLLTASLSLPRDRYVDQPCSWHLQRGERKPICLNLVSHDLSVILRIKLMRSSDANNQAVHPSAGGSENRWYILNPSGAYIGVNFDFVRSPLSFSRVKR